MSRNRQQTTEKRLSTHVTSSFSQEFFVITAAEIIMFDNVITVFKFVSDLHFYVTGSQEENELILVTVLQALFDAISLLLRCVGIAHLSTDGYENGCRFLLGCVLRMELCNILAWYVTYRDHLRRWHQSIGLCVISFRKSTCRACARHAPLTSNR